jgi:hypothetical protein
MRYVRENFDWPVIARRTLDVYRAAPAVAATSH